MEISIVVPKDYRNQLQKMGNTIAKNIAVMARDAITTEAAYAVDMFYAAYTPRYYKRKNTLYQSFRKYYKNPHGSRFHGGVEFSASGMADVHHDSPSQVLSTSLSGYHGRTSRGIYTEPTIYEHVVRFRDSLFANIGALNAAGAFGV